MTESEFGNNFYSTIGAIKDAVSATVVEACIKEGLSKDATARVSFAVNATIESMGDRCYQSLSRGMKKFFRK